jgi:hypothetical protein
MDELFYAPSPNPLPPRVAQPSEPLFSFMRDHDWFSCELLYHGESGVETQILKNDELLIGRAVRHRRTGGAVGRRTAEGD